MTELPEEYDSWADYVLDLAQHNLVEDLDHSSETGQRLADELGERFTEEIEELKRRAEFPPVRVEIEVIDEKKLSARLATVYRAGGRVVAMIEPRRLPAGKYRVVIEYPASSKEQPHGRTN
jgi:hypothetical protein